MALIAPKYGKTTLALKKGSKFSHLVPNVHQIYGERKRERGIVTIEVCSVSTRPSYTKLSGF